MVDQVNFPLVRKFRSIRVGSLGAGSGCPEVCSLCSLELGDTVGMEG